MATRLFFRLPDQMPRKPLKHCVRCMRIISANGMKMSLPCAGARNSGNRRSGRGHSCRCRRIRGYAVGPAYVHEAALPELKRADIADTAAEVDKLDKAIASALEDLNTLQRKRKKTSGKANARIFGVHKMMLEDKEMRDKAVTMIQDEKSMRPMPGSRSWMAWLRAIVSLKTAT